MGQHWVTSVEYSGQCIPNKAGGQTSRRWQLLMLSPTPTAGRRTLLSVLVAGSLFSSTQSVQVRCDCANLRLIQLIVRTRNMDTEAEAVTEAESSTSAATTKATGDVKHPQHPWPYLAEFFSILSVNRQTYRLQCHPTEHATASQHRC